MAFCSGWSFLYLCLMLRWIQILCFVPTGLLAQVRNDEVRRLNDVVAMMDEASRLNYTWYHDAVQLAEAMDESRTSINPNYFYTSRSSNKTAVHYTGIEKAFRFKELVPDGKGYLPAYMADLIPWLEKRERVLAAQQKPHVLTSELDALIARYILSTDSLYAAHNRLCHYVTEKAYLNDASFSGAKAILRDQEQRFETCYQASQRLSVAIQSVFERRFPPNKSHSPEQRAEQEMRRSTNLLDDWQQCLAKGDASRNARYDSLLRQLNREAMAKDSLYLSSTRGYGQLHNGWWAHSRYRSFYSMLQSTVYWYAGSRQRSEPYLKDELVRYNGFINGYNTAMEYYNRFVDLFDGRHMALESSCCLSPAEIDTAQNVWLHKPRLLHRFAYVDTSQPNHAAEPADQKTAAVGDDVERIGRALPHHLVYLLDASSSMNEPDRLPELKAQVKYLVRLQRPADRLSIVSFASHAQVVLRDKACTPKPGIYASIDALHALGSTNISEGVTRAVHIADSCRLSNGVTKILLFTDGAFQLRKADLRLLRTLQGKQIGFCLVYLGHAQHSTEEELRKICGKLNWRYYSAYQVNLKEILIREASE